MMGSSWGRQTISREDSEELRRRCEERGIELVIDDYGSVIEFSGQPEAKKIINEIYAEREDQ